jgi:hypothetical protein
MIGKIKHFLFALQAGVQIDIRHEDFIAQRFRLRDY